MNPKTKKIKKYVSVIIILIVIVMSTSYVVLANNYNNANEKMINIEFTSCDVSNQYGVNTSKLEGTRADISHDKTMLNIHAIDLAFPGACAQFNSTVVNNGNTPIKIKNVILIGLEETTDIKIKGLEAILASHPVLRPEEKCNITFMVERESNSDIESENINKSANFSLKIEYDEYSV